MKHLRSRSNSRVNFYRPLHIAPLVVCLAAVVGVARDAAAQQWLTDANARIETHRKANLTVEVVDSDGNPVSGADVHVEMKRHTFGFGTAVTANWINDVSEDGITYKQKLLENFNQVVFENDLKWPPWDGLWGGGFNWPNTEVALDWLDTKNLPARGHYLSHATMSGGDDEDGGDGNLTTLKQRLFDHIDDKAGTVGSRVFEWDVINHPVGWTGQTYETELPEGTDIFKQIIDHARTAAPAGMPMWINEDDVIAGNSSAFDFERIIDYMQANGSSPDGIGFQGHFIEEWGRVSGTPASVLYDRIDVFGDKGVPLRVTELDIDVRFDTSPDPGFQPSPDDPVLQGQLMNDYLTVMFSHPEMEAVTMWGFWGGSHWRDDPGALYESDWDEKPSLTAYQNLVFNEWWSDEIGASDGSGEYDVRAFKGLYDITVNYGGEEFVLSDYDLSGDANVEIPLALLVALQGDYNGDDVVDGADYTVWHDTIGQSVTPGTGADGDGDGVIGPGDYDEWVAHFGDFLPPGSGSGSANPAVPEPASVLLFLTALAGVALARRRRFSVE